MDQEELNQRWQQQGQEVSKAIAEWRTKHPKATFADIEAAVDEQMNRVRARLIEEVAQTNPQVEQVEATEARTSTCPQCGQRMQTRGKRQRSVQTHGGQEVILSRDYLSCPFCGYSFFPPR